VRGVRRLLGFVLALSGVGGGVGGVGVGLAAGDERVPLADNFSPGELQLGVGLAVEYGLATALEGAIANGRPPVIGAPPGFDRDLADALYRGPGAGKWLGGVPDVAGSVVLPALVVGWYGADALALWARGRSLGGGHNADHALAALAEGYLVDLALTQTTKLAIGRVRPYVYLQRPDPAPVGDTDLSFYSGHASSSFYLAAFVHRDLSDWLVAGPLAGAGGGTRLVVGRLLPGALLYGIAGTIAVSRVVDQAHYPTDVLAGAAVGTALGNLFYSLHFDADGRPRRRRATSLDVSGFPGGIAVSGAF
jgi:membrane-associated phospholipid phosphatase